MMAFFRDDTFEHYEMPHFRIISDVDSPVERATTSRGIQTISGKTKVPHFPDAIERPRLKDFLSRSAGNFAATLISGRAGSGKTTFAAEYVAGDSSIAWYTLDTADGDWAVFQHYLWIALLGDGKPKGPWKHASEFLANVMTEFEKQSRSWPSTVVLDGIHHLFDAEWFGECFGLLIASLPSDTHLIILCRSKPPNPLWRLRSKQVLNVIDEKLLAFSQSETEELFRRNGAKREDARKAHRFSLGHPGKLARILSEGA